MPSYTLGLDLGQRRDPSAAVLIERRWRFLRWRRDGWQRPEPVFDRHFTVRGLWRFALGRPFSAVIDDVAAIMAKPELVDRTWLAYDVTGLGVGVFEQVYEAWRAGRLGRYQPGAITIVSGASQGSSVDKGDMVSTLAVAIESGRLEIPKRHPLTSKLLQELDDFVAETTAAGNWSFGARTESAHDDLVTAACLALWWSGRHQQGGVETIPYAPADLSWADLAIG
jgi:hypothetical protein